MRILVINPNTTQAMTDEIHHVAKAAAAPGTQVTTVQPAAGPRSIEGNADEVLAGYHTLDVVAGSRGQYDAYVIACFGEGFHLGACFELHSMRQSACHKVPHDADRIHRHVAGLQEVIAGRLDSAAPVIPRAHFLQLGVRLQKCAGDLRGLLDEIRIRRVISSRDLPIMSSCEHRLHASEHALLL